MPPGRPTDARRLRLLVPALLAAAAVAAFAPARNGVYVQDDLPAVAENAVVARGRLAEIWTTDYWAGAGLPDRALYRPVTVTSFALERGPSGPVPRRSHDLNLALHAGAAVLVHEVALAAGAGLPAAAAAGLLFAVHPVHAPAAAAVAGRSELLAALFGLGAVLALRGGGRERARAWAAGALLFLALGSKETAFGIVPVLVLVALPRWRLLAPSALALAAHLALRIQAVGAGLVQSWILPYDDVLRDLDGASRLSVPLALLARYARLLLAPPPLAADYAGPATPRETALLSLPAVGGALLLALLVLGIARFRTRPRLALGCALFLGPYLVVGNLLVSNGAGFAPRLLYLPSAGAALLAGLAWDRLRAWTPRGGAVILAALALAGLLAARREARTWLDPETLFRAAFQAEPGGVRAPFVLGTLAAHRGDLPAALEFFERTIRNWPEHGAAHMEKGIVLGRMGRNAEAEASFRQAARIDPGQPEVRMWLGTLLATEGRHAEAERELRRAVLLGPGLVEAEARLALLLAQTGRYREAAAAYARCVDRGRSDLAPQLAEARRLAGEGS